MPITRTSIIDDDGSGTTGTVIDNAWKQEFYNQIDALAGGLAVTYGTFTPVDHYASAAINAEAAYAKVGRLVFIQMQIYFPTISGNPNVVWLDGLPFPVSGTASGGSGFYQTKGNPMRMWSANVTSFYAYDTTTGANVGLNAMTGQHTMLSGSYLTT